MSITPDGLLNKEAEEKAIKDNFEDFLKQPLNVEGIDLMNKSIKSMMEGAYLAGAKYATDRITKMFMDSFGRVPGSIPFPKL